MLLISVDWIHWTPPTRNSATQSARAEITSAAPMRIARAERKGLSFMI